MHDRDMKNTKARHNQLIEHFGISQMEPECTDEYIKVPLDLPWNDLAKDCVGAFEEFGWYGMVHRRHTDWVRSPVYGGLGLTYNPDYKFDIPKHAHGLGQPRASSNSDDIELWIKSLEIENYSGYKPDYKIQKGFNTYDDCLGLRVPTPVTEYRSFSTIFEKLKFRSFQGRLVEIRNEGIPDISEENKEFLWHIDEQNEIIARILIPLIYDEDYYIEFKETGTKMHFEPGYGYHFNTRKIHRWNYNWHPKIKNRTCMVLAFSPWITYEDGIWGVNEYCNKLHPTDMVKKGLVI